MILLAIALAAAISAQPTDEAADDAPVSTAVRQPAVSAEEVPAPPAATQPAAAPAAEAGAKALTFESKTLVDGPTLQVVLGQRAVFAVDPKGQPRIEKVEEGQLTAAHVAEVAEAFAAPDAGLLAAAVDGSAEKRATVLKVWNGSSEPVEFRAVALVMRPGGKLAPAPVPACPVAAGQVRTQSFPAPIVAIGLSGFKTATKETLARPGCK